MPEPLMALLQSFAAAFEFFDVVLELLDMFLGLLRALLLGLFGFLDVLLEVLDKSPEGQINDSKEADHRREQEDIDLIKSLEDDACYDAAHQVDHEAVQ